VAIARTRRITKPNFIDVNSDSESILVNAPLSEVYHRCLRFEDFPAFINSISKMDKIDNTRFSCTSSINGEEVQSDVQIIMRVPDRRIAWRAASDHFRVYIENDTERKSAFATSRSP
jgi:uncharacterized membrane protein